MYPTQPYKYLSSISNYLLNNKPHLWCGDDASRYIHSSGGFSCSYLKTKYTIFCDINRKLNLKVILVPYDSDYTQKYILNIVTYGIP